jgi:YVTN family beta-propeller protein
MGSAAILTASLFRPALSQQTSSAGPTSATPYSIYVASESGDVVTRIDVGQEGWKKAGEVSVKVVPNEISGPHNVAVSPDGKFWYVSIAHGTPNGSLWKFDAQNDRLLGRVQVGVFPTTIGLSPDGRWAFVPNSDLHGDRGKLNTISAVHTPSMAVVTEIPTCDMPHGSRWSRAGSVVYVACMMSDELVAIDPGAFAVSKRVALGSGRPMAMPDHTMPGAASSTMPGQSPDCLATYVSVSPDDRQVYVACNHSNELQVRDAASLVLVERIPLGEGAYNVEPSPDGRFVLVTNKKEQSVSVVDARTPQELARIATSKSVPHGIAFSPDGRYAFVSCESVGTDPGAVDVIDLTTLARVASMEIARQPTGIAVRGPGGL